MTDPLTWQLCIAVFTAVGHKETVARALIGKWLRDYTEQDVVDAVTAAAGKADPVSYARKILQSKPTKGRRVQDQLVSTENVQPANREHVRQVISQSWNILKGRT